MRAVAEAVMNSVNVNRTAAMLAGPPLYPSSVHSFPISDVVDRLLLHVPGGSRKDNNDITHLCLSLAKGIDHAVVNNERPVRAPDLPPLLKQLCQWRIDIPFQAAVMVLMLSMKAACKIGWFSEKDNEELHKLYDETASSFCSVRDMNSVEKTFHRSIAAIMSRFYPRMKMREIITFVEAMPGYGAFVKDFHITENAISSNKTYLFVAQTDNIETSACIISPQLVNILLNGKPVDRRTCVYKDPGPQTPTELTKMLQNGTNLLQVLGQFNGKYIIAVAIMSMISNPSCPTLPDYVPQADTAPDNDIVEGPSRISLNCPISFKRIKTPVKGQLCKHLQCFDFDNYVDINSRRPSWRCPHCSQSVCYNEIRIDQSMVKVLKEVGANATHVKISADGSWEALNKDDTMDKPPLHQDYMTFQDKSANILDLTEGDNDMNVSNSCQDGDSKPSPAQLQDQRNAIDQIPSQVNINNGVWRDAVSQDQSQLFAFNNTHLATHSNVMNEPVTHNVQMAIPQGQSHISASNTGNEYGRYPTPATHVTQNPVAVQALPAQTSSGMVTGDTRQFSRFNLSQQQILHIISARPSQQLGSQNWNYHDHSHISSQTVPQFGGRYGQTSAYSSNPFNTHQCQSLNQRISNPAPQVHQGVVGPTTGHGSNQQANQYHTTAVQQANQNQNRNWTPSVPAPGQASLSSMHAASLEDQRGQGQGQRVSEGYDEQNWRPSGRMRGSLSGRAYSDALNQYIILPTPPVQAARLPVLNAPRPVVPSHLQALLANNRNAHAHAQDGDGCLDAI